MKHLRQCLIAGFLVQLAMSHILYAMNEAKTEELKQYLNGLVRQRRESKIKPNSDELYRVVKELVQEGADPNIPTDFGLNHTIALHFAAEADNIDLIRFLCLHHSNIEAKSEDNITPLNWAAQKGNTNALAKLVGFGANIETSDNEGWTPLMSAFINGNREVAFLLIGFGANVNPPAINSLLRIAQDEIRDIFSTWSSKEGELPVGPFNRFDKYKQTPFNIALVTRNKEAISFLLSQGADPLEGLYNGILLASRIPEWRVRGAESLEQSLYEQILAVPLDHCLVILLAFKDKLPRELAAYIIYLMLSLRSR